ncbi:MAG TPA: amino acid adenylation domain-containing protein, partial [Thermoanaerobaculia bacterium]|nr:amino acid adenylation domain-containing protein [Thermoanaerobaculia bacterium]
MRWVVFGGEALEPRSLESWWRRHETGLVNMYGITETTVHVTYRRLGEAEILDGGRSVIGVPLRDLSIHVLDSYGAPVPIGVAGEMYVGGAGVALGYLNRPELTAERFVPDQSGARLYRSGDLGRWRASGELEYLGRIDHQVKVRGFRIELGEIESVLLQKPGVEAAVVLAREDTPGDRRLVAYVVGEAEGLRAWVKERLPEYMVPAAFVALEALPLTPNGKVDRKALPAPGLGRSESGYVAPRTEEEEMLAAVWSQVLGLDRVGVEDNFFALGGDSILSLRVVAMAGERGLAITLPDLFQHQTLAELAAAIRKTSSAAVRSEPFSLVSAEDRARLPEDIEDAYPLATLQAGMLYHMELTPEDPLYHNVDSWQVKGRFEQEVFEEAVRRVVARHPILRTSFAMSGYSEPLQLVHRHAVLPLTVENIRHSTEQEAAIDRLVAREKIGRFDLTKAPQLRFHVFLRSAETYQFTLAENHAIFDGWSLHSTLAEIFELYLALLSGAAPEPLPPLDLTYREFVRLESEALDSAETREYWRGVLDEAEPVELPRWPAPWLRPGPHRMETLELQVAPEVVAGLKRLARAAAVPLKSVLLAAHCRVLSLLTGRQDVVGGLVANGRLEESEGDQVRGLFLNTLPLRLRLPEGSWQDLVRAVFRAEQEMLPHRRYPFGALQRQWGERPLFDVVFNFIRFHVVRDLMRSGDLEILGFKKAEGGNFKLTAHFTLDLEQQGLQLELEYDSRAVAAPQAREIVDAYRRALAAMAREPESAYDAVPVLAPATLHRLLWEHNDTAAAWQGAERCLHELLAEQAQKVPDRVAVAAGSLGLTFGELFRRSRQLARRLRRLGVGPEVRVAVCQERTPELVVSLLAVLEAGGAYVPLDPGHPAERTGTILEDAGAAVLVTEERWLAVLPPHGARVVCVDRDREAIAAEAPRPLGVEVDPESLAYVIYTSGSTGRPKGVQLPHRAVVRFLLAMAARPGLTAADVVPALTTITFDIAGLEVYLPLLVGGRVEMVGRDEATDGIRLAARLAACGATAVQATPATWRLLVDSGWQGAHGLKALCGGEALPRELAAALGARVGSLWNVYGPTETAVWSAAGEVREAAEDNGPVPLGPPIANTRFYVVDRASRLAPVGVPGELWIAGDGLARGYLGRLELTAEQFVPDPFGEEAGSRVYRTGDLVRHRPGGRQGALEFLGRVDFQVKVRGFRIELGEIEAALGRHPGVAQAVVLATGEAAERRLAAYLVTREGTAVPDLRAFLLRSLPEYMVPSAFVTLPAFPLTPSGKVDRRALAASAAPEPWAREAARYVAPEGPVEEMMAEIWSEVLRVERIGAEDSFFDLGGHSLLATQVASRIRAAFTVELPLQRLFEAATVRALARTVEAARRAEGDHALPPIVRVPRVPRDGFLPLSFAQERIWFLHQLEPGLTAYNLANAMRLRGALDRRALEGCLTRLEARHEALRTRLVMTGGGPAQVVLPPGPFPLERVDLRGVPPAPREAEVRRLAAERGNRPLDLARDRLFQVTLLELGDEDHVLLLLLHHTVADGWSLRVLVRELAALYAAEALPELPVQYADFAVWQRGWLSGEALEAQMGYWRRHLAGAPPLLELPADRPRPVLQTFHGARHSVPLAAETAREVRVFSRRRGLTPFMTFLSAFEALLWRLTGAADVVVGIPIANRNRSEVEGLIGTFVNMLALRTSFAGDETASALAGRVREASLGAFAHQDLPFEKLVDELQPERSQSHAPLFQVMLNLQNQPMGRLDVPGLSFIPVPADVDQVQVDLALALTELLDGQGPAGELQYNRDLFDAATAARLVGHFTSLLAGLLADPQRPVSALPLLSDAERRQLLEEWNDTRVERPRGLLVHALIAAQAAATPQATAVSQGGESVSYAGLEARSNRLARHLRRLGVGPEVRVAVCLERTPELVVALLAVLKTGGAYVPLDPGHPAARTAMVLEDAGAAVLVTEERWLAVLPPHDAYGVCVDRDREAIAASLSAPPEQEVDGENLAYVIYTSGSTGRPKGVQLPHRAVMNFLLAMAGRPGLTARDVVPALTTITFDIAGLEVYLPLLVGGRVEIVGREEATDGVRLAARLVACGATVMQATPATWRLLLESGWQGDPGLKALCGGEALPRDLAEALRARVGSLWNVYGPTETAVWSAAGEVREASEDNGPVPFGPPIANTRFYVVDRACGPVPVGVAGELWIGGDGLARGYLGRPELTAETFVPDPFGEEGARAYRTGDLVRYRPGGELEFLGRIDFQVKVRGFRIELGEIEAALGSHPAVAQAVVVATGAGAETRLVAYAVARGEARPEELRRHLRDRLPEYMVPSAFVALDALPLTPSGKVDRKALPAPESTPETDTDYAAPSDPSDPISELLAVIWAEVLGTGRVGVHDDFFALGGHSLLATRVVSRVRAVLGVELPLRALFAAPTVAELARVVRTVRESREGPQTPPLVPAPRAGDPPLSFAQQRLWLIDQLEPGSPAFNIPSAVRLTGE